MSPTLLDALRVRGVTRIRQVRFKPNRVRLLSVSRDGATLHAHECFRQAPPEIVEAMAAFLHGERGGAAYARAVARVRSWAMAQRDAGERTLQAASARRRPPRPGACCATPAQRAYLASLYRQLNRSRFGGRLPEELPLRLSSRMSRRLGHVRYHRREDGARVAVELALGVDLLLEGNERQLIDTLLHEMAHVEAWLAHGHRGHGAPWQRIARRVGCEPRACTRAKIARRASRRARVTRVPPAPAES